eukprot:364500-Chlamydomonas_euryale.AAC.23
MVRACVLSGHVSIMQRMRGWDVFPRERCSVKLHSSWSCVGAGAAQRHNLPCMQPPPLVVRGARQEAHAVTRTCNESPAPPTKRLEAACNKERATSCRPHLRAT